MEVMALLLIIAGGVALLLFGVRFLRKGLDRLFGMRLGHWVQRAGEKPGRAFLTGIGVSAIAPSSTTMSLLAVQAVQAGQMNARQMLAVMLGANIGLTIMVQFVALDLDQFAPILILIGVFLYQYFTRNRIRGVGQVLLSLGIIFLALGVIKSAVPSEIDPDGDLGRLIAIAENYPVGIMLLAAVLTIVTHSSTAAIGLLIGLLSAGAVGFDMTVPAVFGANVGLAITTMIFGWSQLESRRLAMGNLALKLLGALIGLAMLPLLLAWLNEIPISPTIKLACVHTGFNVAIAIIGLPLVAPMSRMLDKLIPTPKRGQGDRDAPRYLDLQSTHDVRLAMGQSAREIMRVAEIVRSMFDDIWKALKDNDEELVAEVGRRDDQVDKLDAAIKKFLTRSIKDDIEGDDADEQLRQLRYLSELETIGDIIDKNIVELVKKKIRLGAYFSKSGMAELDEFHRKIGENLLISETAFAQRDTKLAEQLLRHKETVSSMEQEMRDKHFARLNEGLQESHETSAIHLDLLTHLKRINSCVTHVAYAILRRPKKSGREKARETD